MIDTRRAESDRPEPLQMVHVGADELGAIVRTVVREEIQALPTPRSMLDIRDLAALFKVSRSQAYALGRRIPRFQPRGMHARWRREDVETFIAEHIVGRHQPRSQHHTTEAYFRELERKMGADHAARVRATMERLRRGIRTPRS